MKAVRKGFTLIELLVVIAILGTLAAAMSLSSSSATAAAKAATIYQNINAIKTAAVVYQLREGSSFKESSVTQAKLKEADIIDLDLYNKKDGTDNAIQYSITAGVDGGAGAYVVCNFTKDNDNKAISDALASYPNLRFDTDKKAVGAFLFHNTPATKPTGDDVPSYEADFTFTATTSTEDTPGSGD